ncbi:MAG: hypothetical protein EOO20_28890, partial [Chryseobacterium sp.]
MPLRIRGVFKNRLIMNLGKLKLLLHHKKRRLCKIILKLDQFKSRGAKKLCFGTGKLFRAQYNLETNGFIDHGEWLEFYRLARSSSMTFVGSSDESYGNQTVQFDIEKKCLKIRLPNARIFEHFGKNLVLQNIDFPIFLHSDFENALSNLSGTSKLKRKSAHPITYRIVRRHNKINGRHSYYLQATFTVEAKEVSSIEGIGVVGLDLNADHLALCETDRFGNCVDSLILPYSLRGLSSEQSKAIIGDLAAVVISHCQNLKKPLVIEELDFAAKKVALNLMPKVRRKFLSSFAYSAFMKAFISKSRSLGISIITINPAYTSLIGAYKYQGLN